MVRTWLQDFGHALRLLRRSPGFTAAAVAALALGIGANTAIFSVVDSVLLRPLPYRAQDRLVVIWESSPRQGWARIGPSGPNFVDFKQQSKSFESVAVLEPGSGTFTGFGEPRQILGMRVSNNYLSLLGVKPALGRDFLASETWNNRVAIISYNLWQRELGGDPSIIGRVLKADGLAYTVVGVLPKDYWSVVPSEALVPWGDLDLLKQGRNDHRFGMIGRLKPGVTAAEATAELSGIERRLANQFAPMKGWTATVVPMRQLVSEGIGARLWLLLGAVALVLCIGCVNLANLLLARAVERRREVAVRMALGAGRRRLLQQFLIESTVLALLGGAAGFLFALWGIDLLRTFLPDTIRVAGTSGEVTMPAISVDRVVLLFTTAVSLLTGLLFGIGPAWAASRTDTLDNLREGARGGMEKTRRPRMVLAAAEIGMALVLLVGTAHLLKSFWQLSRVEPGFSPSGAIAMEMELPTDSKYKTGAEMTTFFRKVIQNVQALPGVQSAGVTSVLPLDASEDAKTEFSIQGRPEVEGNSRLPADYRAVSAGYFQAMAIPLRRGRFIEDSDVAGRPFVAVISETMAHRFWHSLDEPIGQRLRLRGHTYEIVGVAGNVRGAGLDREAPPLIYTGFEQNPEFRMSLVARAAGNPRRLVFALKQAVYQVDPDQPVFKVRTLGDVLEAWSSPARTTMWLIGIFACVATLLAGLGIYGVLSYGVAQRQREFGVRLALGAKCVDIVSLIGMEGLKVTLAGAAAGLLTAPLLMRAVAGLLYGVTSHDLTAYAAAALLTFLAAALACALPAFRASSVDAATQLRAE
jgi:putative ABC transport system permease protein